MNGIRWRDLTIQWRSQHSFRLFIFRRRFGLLPKMDKEMSRRAAAPNLTSLRERRRAIWHWLSRARSIGGGEKFPEGSSPSEPLAASQLIAIHGVKPFDLRRHRPNSNLHSRERNGFRSGGSFRPRLAIPLASREPCSSRSGELPEGAHFRANTKLWATPEKFARDQDVRPVTGGVSPDLLTNERSRAVFPKAHRDCPRDPALFRGAGF